MKRYVKEATIALLFITILSVGMLSGASDVWAQGMGGTLTQQIQGSWVLVSIYNERDGKKTEVFGPNPRGSLILTPDGRFSAILMNASLRSLLPTSARRVPPRKIRQLSRVPSPTSAAIR